MQQAVTSTQFRVLQNHFSSLLVLQMCTGSCLAPLLKTHQKHTMAVVEVLDPGSFLTYASYVDSGGQKYGRNHL